jgi:putative phosphotransacetylase
MKIIAEISARHIHLSPEDLEKLFGHKYKLNKLKSLSQPGEFAAQETVELISLRDHLSVRVVGPTRPKTQVELSVTDCRRLDIKPIFKISGDLKGTGRIKLKGPNGLINLQSGVIVPLRHLHISPAQAKIWCLSQGQKIKVKVAGPRAMVLENIVVRFGHYKPRIHLDTDEANAAGLLKNSQVTLSK